MSIVYKECVECKNKDYIVDNGGYCCECYFAHHQQLKNGYTIIERKSCIRCYKEEYIVSQRGLCYRCINNEK